MASIDSPKTTVVVVKAEVGLYEDAMRGRAGYRNDVRPNHSIPWRGYTFTGHILFSDRDILRPGECCEAAFDCLIIEQGLPLFVSGFIWSIQEAFALVGYDKVLSVIRSSILDL